MQEPSDDRVGREIADGRYRIERLLGAGGMGEVYLAVDTESGRRVAVKLLNARFSVEESHLRRFQREAEVTSRLDHPHVVRALDSGVDADGTPYLVMEWIEGESLSAYMRRRGGQPLDVPVVVSIARQVLAALAAAAEINVIHRDLKPGNVMIVETDAGLHARVVDFGLARFLKSETYQTLTLTGQVLGTPGYMAPEQAFGDVVDARADIFSVGAIMYALLTGAPPFGSGPEVLARLLNDERVPLSESHEELGPITEVVDRCLAPDPDDRYPAAEALDRELVHFERGKTTVVEWKRPSILPSLVLARDSVLDAVAPAVATRSAKRPPAETEVEAPRSTQRHTRVFVLAGLVAFVLGVGVVYLAMGRSPQPNQQAVLPAVSPVAMDTGDAAVPMDASPVIDAPVPDAVGEPDPAAPAASERSTVRDGQQCRGVTRLTVHIQPNDSAVARALRERAYAQVLYKINDACYTTRTMPTRAVLRFEVESPGHMRGLRFVDHGRLSRSEQACVRRHVRQLGLGSYQVGAFLLRFDGHTFDLELEFEPRCEDP